MSHAVKEILAKNSKLNKKEIFMSSIAKKKKVVVLHSGGLDSTVLLYFVGASNPSVEIISLGFEYGSRHNRKENEAAAEICHSLGVVCRMVQLVDLSMFRSSLLQSSDEDIPEGYYTDENMKSTVVPFRNGILLSIAAGFAESRGASHVAYGAHAGDHYIYPDCRPEFYFRMAGAIRLGTESAIELYAPFIDMKKDLIVSLGARLGVPFEKTWTCYKGGELHCGRCGSCVERKEAFVKAGIKDPTKYMK